MGEVGAVVSPVKFVCSQSNFRIWLFLVSQYVSDVGWHEFPVAYLLAVIYNCNFNDSTDCLILIALIGFYIIKANYYEASVVILIS